jgi:hypothetical protein
VTGQKSIYETLNSISDSQILFVYALPFRATRIKLVRV